MNYLQLIKNYGLNEVKEQKEFLTNPNFVTPDKPLVLAGGTGFGKTFTTILKLIMFYSNPENKGKKTIILPSSTKVLRNNFTEAFDKVAKSNNLPFVVKSAEGKREFKRLLKSDVDIIIALPQTLANIEELPKVEWLVVDEAHKWYFEKTIDGIIKKTEPTYQLLLTGTPFKFNARKQDYTMFYVPIEDMIEQGLVGNPLIEVVSSSIDLKKDDYNAHDVVRTDIKWSYKQDKNQLVQVAKEVQKTLKTRYRNNTIGRLLGVFGIDKTIIYCYSVPQARHFYKAFQSSDLAGQVLLSEHKSDMDSIEFDKFKTEEKYRVLLVVNRGREGFDMPELFNIVDFTLSPNPEVILQILGRVLRISEKQPNKQKVYYKVASQNTAPFILTLMTGVLQLVKREYYETFTGKFDEIKIPMMPKERTPRNTNPNRNRNGFSARALRYFQEVNIPLEANFWNQLKFRQGDIWKTMGQTTLKQVLSEAAGHTPWDSLTEQDVRESAKDFDSLVEWMKADLPAYRKAQRLGIFDEVTSNMSRRTRWTYELVKKEALKYNSKGEFNKKNDPAYSQALKQGWIDDVCSHMEDAKRGRKNVKWNYERCKEEASKYTKRYDFEKGCKQAYRASHKKGWIDEFIPKNNFTLKTK